MLIDKEGWLLVIYASPLSRVFYLLILIDGYRFDLLPDSED